MANVINTPLMNLPNPVPNVDPGPDYAENIKSCFNILDQHNHTPGSGKLITPGAMNINSDLPMSSNNLTLARSIRFSPQGSQLAGADDLGCIYEAGGDFYYNNSSGIAVKITNGNNIVGAAGTISGLPSGTASATYSGGTFVFQSATSTSATIDGGSLILRNNTASSKGLTLNPPNAMASDYSLTLPSIPGSLSFLSVDTSGNIGAYASVSGGITGSNIAAGTITATNMGAASVTGGTGGIVASNIALPGKLVTVGGNLTSTTVESSPLVIVRGTVTNTGTINSGSGFSVASVTTGTWDITFTTTFADVPAVVISPAFNGTPAYAEIETISSSVVRITTWVNGGSPSNFNMPFSFIAIGQRA